MTTTAEATFRSAQAADRDAIRRLWETAGLARATAQEWDALMGSPTSKVLVAAREGAVVGAAVATFDGWRAYIYHVAVAEPCRRLGIGHGLLAEAERHLRNAGASYVFAAVDPENTEGLALGASNGYLPEGEIVMAKPLALPAA